MAVRAITTDSERNMCIHIDKMKATICLNVNTIVVRRMACILSEKCYTVTPAHIQKSKKTGTTLPYKFHLQ
jgi:dissimilatory sulfite reductase (desulfoviridin) alpha/beta subunit